MYRLRGLTMELYIPPSSNGCEGRENKKDNQEIEPSRMYEGTPGKSFYRIIYAKICCTNLHENYKNYNLSTATILGQ